MRPQRTTDLCVSISSTPMHSRSARTSLIASSRLFRETMNISISNPERHQTLRAIWQWSEALAARTGDEFLPKPALQPDRVSGIAAITADAITYKVLASPLTRRGACGPHPDSTIRPLNHNGPFARTTETAVTNPMQWLALASVNRARTTAAQAQISQQAGAPRPPLIRRRHRRLCRARTLATHMSGRSASRWCGKSPGAGRHPGTDAVARPRRRLHLVIMDPAIVINPTLQRACLRICSASLPPSRSSAPHRRWSSSRRSCR